MSCHWQVAIAKAAAVEAMVGSGIGSVARWMTAVLQYWISLLIKSTVTHMTNYLCST